MQGRVLGYDELRGDGAITDGHDRYSFTLEEWKSERPPSEGVEVDFVPVGGAATEVYFVGQPAQQVARQQAAYEERRSKVVAGLLGIFLGGFGIHRFYLGYVGIGIAQIVVTVLTLGVGSIWGFVEGILLLVGAMDRDAEGRPLRS